MPEFISSRRSLLTFFFCLFFCSTAQAAEFVGLGSLIDGGPYDSRAHAVSADGSIVVGYSYTPPNNAGGFRWTESEGMQGFDGFPGAPTAHTIPYGISADGRTVVGLSINESNAWEAFRWTADSGMIGFGSINGDTTIPSDVSADGTVIVGRIYSVSNINEAFRWTVDGGMVGLGYLEGGAAFSNAVAVSDDGHIVVGTSDSTNGYEAFRWTANAGMIGLGFLPGGSALSYANDVSAGGSVIVGSSNTATGHEAFRWTAEDGMVGLGYMNAGSSISLASAASADGKVIVGHEYLGDTYEAFRWTESNGLESIADLLIEAGIDLTGWELVFARDISADGTVIVGDGYSPNSLQYYTEAWLVRIDSGLITPEIVTQSVNTLLPVTESSHALVRESLDTHLMASRHYRGRPESRFNMYVSGFGGEWNSYTAGGTLGMAWDVNESVRMGGGLFTSTYHEDDLAYSSNYELESFGGTLWAGYQNPNGGLQFHVVGLLAGLDNEIERGYMNGSGLDKSKGTPDGDMTGLLARVGWNAPISENTSFTPFASYTWTEVEIDAYTETGGGFPAHFDSRKDNTETLKVGVEGEKQICESVKVWGQVAYGNRLEDDSSSISGGLVGLMDFSLPGYNLDDDWFEADLGFKWQAAQNMSIMLTGGSAFGNDQNPEWRTSLGVSWAL